MTSTRSEELGIALDRDADVPIGVQLAWALRARILGGSLLPGHRLPALHRLAGELGVNANTIRAVYQRLEQNGLVETHHGSGTYVTGTEGDRATLAQLVTGAADAAHDAGIDPRDVAAALYVGARSSLPPDDDAAARRRLRAQIATLEQALSDLVAHRPDLASSGLAPASASARAPAARLLDTAALADQRAALLRKLAEAQAAVDAPRDDGQADSRTARRVGEGLKAPSAAASRRRALRAAPGAT